MLHYGDSIRKMLEAPLDSLTEAQLLERIKKYEKTYAQLVEQNNSYELAYQSQLYRLYKHDRPIHLKNAFTEAENELLSGNTESNPEYLSSLTIQLDEESDRIEAQNNQMTLEVNDQRSELNMILKQIEPELPSDIPTPRTDHPSQDVIKLARKLAYKIDDVDGNKLVSLLANGPTNKEEEQKIISLARQLGQLRYQIDCEKNIESMLDYINSKLSMLAQNDNIDNQEPLQNLISSIEESSCQLQTMVEQVEYEHNPQESNEWQHVRELQEQVSSMRIILMESLQSKSQFSFPTEFCDLEKEKEVLKQCLKSLRNSIQIFKKYLHQLTQDGIVDTKIITEEEARSIYMHYNELKLQENS